MYVCMYIHMYVCVSSVKNVFFMLRQFVKNAARMPRTEHMNQLHGQICEEAEGLVALLCQPACV